MVKTVGANRASARFFTLLHAAGPAIISDVKTFQDWRHRLSPSKSSSRLVQAACVVAAISVLLLDTVVLSQADALNRLTIQALGLLVALLATVGWFGPIAELAFVMTYSVVALSPIGTDLAFVVLGIYLITILWIVRSWLVGAYLIFFLTHIAQFSSSFFSAPSLLSVALGLLIVTLVGFGLRWQNSRMNEALELARSSEEKAIQATAQVRSELACLLHDTIAKDLSRISLVAQDLAQTPQWQPDKLEALAKNASDASRRIRPVILNLNSTERSNIRDTIVLTTRMLSTRAICLETNIGEVDLRLTAQQELLAGLVVREGCTNILKYAPAGSQASLVISDDDAVVSITLSNIVVSNPQTDLIGGFGLENLRNRLEQVGGEISYFASGGRWILYATIPPSTPRKEQTDGS